MGMKKYLPQVRDWGVLRVDGPASGTLAWLVSLLFAYSKYTLTDRANKITGLFSLHGDSYVVSKVTKNLVNSEWTQMPLFIQTSVLGKPRRNEILLLVPHQIWPDARANRPEKEPDYNFSREGAESQIQKTPSDRSVLNILSFIEEKKFSPTQCYHSELTTGQRRKTGCFSISSTLSILSFIFKVLVFIRQVYCLIQIQKAQNRTDNFVVRLPQICVFGELVKAQMPWSYSCFKDLDRQIRLRSKILTKHFLMFIRTDCQTPELVSIFDPIYIIIYSKEMITDMCKNLAVRWSKLLLLMCVISIQPPPGYS